MAAVQTGSRLAAPAFLAWLEAMHGCGNAGTAAKRIFQVERTPVLFEQIAERLVGEFRKVLHLIFAEKIELPPGLLVELHALARHQPAFLCRALGRDAFFGARAFDRAGLRRAPPPPLPSAFTLWRSASIRLMTFDGALSFGRSIFSPFCFLRSRSLSASS